MIKHFVMFSLKETANGLSKTENAMLMKEKLERMKEKIPFIKHLEVGLNHPQAPVNNVDLILYVEFDSIDDIYRYQQHPAHLEVVDFIRQVRLSRAAIDYEV